MTKDELKAQINVLEQEIDYFILKELELLEKVNELYKQLDELK